jgi:hypothetical protein
MMFRNVRSTISLVFILTFATPLSGMDNLRQRFATGSTQTTMLDAIEPIHTPAHLFKKSWRQRIMIGASLLVQCINNCCGYDDEDGNGDYLDYVRPRPVAADVPVAPVPASLPVTTSDQSAEVPKATSTVQAPVSLPISVPIPSSACRNVKPIAEEAPVSAPTSSAMPGPVDISMAQPPAASSVPEQAPNPETPGTDDEFILNHYQEPRSRLESALTNAPIEAMDLLDMLKYPALYSHKVRFAVLYGPPGIAKSTLAKAIAWKAGWFLELIVGRQVRAEHRGGASIKLQKKFEDIVAKKINTVIVIDEINRLFENYNSTKYDTGDTAEDFWTFLDSQRRNTHLYIIGTANQIDKLPSLSAILCKQHYMIKTIL